MGGKKKINRSKRQKKQQNQTLIVLFRKEVVNVTNKIK